MGFFALQEYGNTTTFWEENYSRNT